MQKERSIMGNEVFGKRVKELREKKKISREQLATE